MSTAFLYSVFANSVNANINADSNTLSELAKAGLSGIVITIIASCVLIIAIFAFLVGVFHYLEVRRYERKEIKRDTELAAIRIEENDSRTKLTETQTKLSDNIIALTKLVETTSERLYDNIKDVKVKVEQLADGMDDLKDTVEKHEKDIQRHDGLLQEYSADYEPQLMIKKRITKKDRAK